MRNERYGVIGGTPSWRVLEPAGTGNETRNERYGVKEFRPPAGKCEKGKL